jgi:N utilization substance protein B
MLNRRHLRIKVLQILYAFYQSNETDVVKAQKEVLFTVERMYDMYLYLLLTLAEVKRAAENKIEERKKKFRPTAEDLNPNLKLVENKIISQLESSHELRKLSEQRKVNWTGAVNQEIFRKMYLQIMESEVFFEHMNNGLSGFEEGRSFAVQLFKTEIANSSYLYHFFEEMSIHWLDDLDLCCSMVLKTLKAIPEKGDFIVLPLFKEDDDEKEFILQLVKRTIEMDSENEMLINELAENWELDRIARMDILLLKMGITELQNFSSIPTKVTLNEYIEISKFYSTPKSNVFINGILDKAISRLTKEKKIVKIGRGLLS